MRALVLLVLVGPMIAAGCGGGSGETTTRVDARTGVGPPAKANHIEVADAICRNHASRREDLESQARELEPIASARNARGVAALLRQEARNRRAEARELAALPAPPSNGASLASLLPVLRIEADLLDEWAQAYDQLDRAAIRRIQIRLGLLAARAARAARATGLQACGQG